MDTYRNELVNALEKATLLVNRLANREISIEQFVSEYGNFFYYEALDGHEADEQRKQLLNEFSDVITFHENIQASVVDLVFLGSSEQKQQYLDAGRIDSGNAEQRVQHLANEYDIGGLLKRLN
uniref:Uncharacterized protein n=1 Tax=Candidatus Kentrum sp. SD TaxID=2126332 RepID=A0A451BHW8_9GAMM|nr:MAG: hypothetical protein BECKSD772D_GA0070982_100334 [Candidatus Kentron sp. SD]